MATNDHPITTEHSAEELREIFMRHGLRTTRQRESVFRTLWRCQSHPTAEQLLAMVHEIDPEVSQATVYNTLDAFVDCGLAHRIQPSTSGGGCRYDVNTHEHVHMVLEDGRILDVPEDLSTRLINAVPQSLIDELSDRMGVSCSGLKIELSGR